MSFCPRICELDFLPIEEKATRRTHSGTQGADDEEWRKINRKDEDKKTLDRL